MMSLGEPLVPCGRGDEQKVFAPAGNRTLIVQPATKVLYELPV